MTTLALPHTNSTIRSETPGDICRPDAWADRLTFIVGAERSGTTWLQDTLGRHPEIITGQESHIFANYLAPLWKTWQAELRQSDGGTRFIGIANYITEDEFVSVSRSFALQVLTNIRSAKPDARAILEKTPKHYEHFQLMSRLFPRARVIHVVRDARAVVASTLAASRGWGRRWAPSRARDAVLNWTRSIECARSGRRLFPSYSEVRYEDFATQGPAVLRRVCEFMGVSTDAELMDNLCGMTKFEVVRERGETSGIVRGGERLRQGFGQQEPKGFFNRGRTDSWKDTLSRRETDEVNYFAGPLLVELGYASADEIKESRRLAWLLRSRARAVRDSIYRRLGRAIVR